METISIPLIKAKDAGDGMKVNSERQ